MTMHHEHHGDCCAPQDIAVREHHHEHASHALGQLCCGGAHMHLDHLGMQAALQSQFSEFEAVEPTLSTKKKKKKSSRALLGSLGMTLREAV